MTQSNKIIKDVSLYSSSFILSQFVTVAAALLMRRFLGPVQVGVWALVQVIMTYAQYSHLGTMQGVSLEIPYQKGRGNEDEVRKLQDTVFTFSTVTAFLTASAVLVYAFWRRTQIDPVLWGGLCFAGALIILERLNAFFICLVRAHKQFEIASTQMFLSAFVNALLVGVLAFHFRLYGFMSAMCLSFLFNIIYILKYSNFRLNFSWDLRRWRASIVYGFPLMLVTLCTTLFETIDRIMIANFLGLRELGHYSIALMAVSYLFSIPNSIGVVLVPNIQEKYGKSQNKSDLKGFLEKSDMVFMTLMPLLIGFSWIAGPFVIRLILPAFTEGIAPMQFLVLGVFFSASGLAYSQFLYAIKKHFLLIPIILSAAILGIILNYAAIRAEQGIEGIALATTITFALYFSLLFFSAVREIYGKKEMLKKYLCIMLQFAWMLLLLKLATEIFDLLSPLQMTLALLLWFVSYLPFLIRIERKLQIVSNIFNRLRRRPKIPTPESGG